jgi:alpha-tubulin suppressor-like RCC1 family protein
VRNLRVYGGCSLSLLLQCLIGFTVPQFTKAAQVVVWGDNSNGQTNVPAAATNVIALAAGDTHCLALRADGQVVAWGNQLATNVPAGLSNVVAIAAGSIHGLALKRDGTVSMWGSFFSSGGHTVPDSVTNVVALALGGGAQHAIALKADGSVIDWGSSVKMNVPPSATNIVAVSAGAKHGLALRGDGRMIAWGDYTTVPVAATDIVSVASAWFGDAGLRANGTIVGWNGSPGFVNGFTNMVELACPFNNIGNDLLGLRPEGTPVASSPSRPVPPRTTNVATIAAGSFNALAAFASGPPIFPGLPIDRTVGTGTTAFFRMKPVGALPMYYQWNCNGTNIPGATNLVLAVPNVQPSLAGSVYTITASNSLGTATSGPMALHEVPCETYLRPLATTNILIASTVTLSADTFGRGPFTYQWQLNGVNLDFGTNATLTLTNFQLNQAGTYRLVVQNAYGSASHEITLNAVPTTVTSMPASQTIFPGGTVTFNTTVQAAIPVSYQWQFNGTDITGATSSSFTITNSQYEDAGEYAIVVSDDYETFTNRASLSIVPVAAWGYIKQPYVSPGLTNITMVSAGSRHGLALKQDGTVVGWGININGSTLPPADLTNAIAVAAGNDYSFALRADGTVVSWGRALIGATNVLPTLSNVVALAAGGTHVLALKSNGTIASWGYDDHGQVQTPQDATNIVAVAAGQWNSMGLRADGQVLAWGAGKTNSNLNPDYGQSIVPETLTGVLQIATGGYHSLAYKADGSIVAWGRNQSRETNVPPGLSNVVSIAAGYDCSLALKSDGTVAAWGGNFDGETNIPAGLTNVIQISAKDASILALLGDSPPTKPQATADRVIQDGHSFGFAVPTRNGRVYALEYKNSLDDPQWISFPLVAGNGKEQLLIDPDATAPQRFYRVREW